MRGVNDANMFADEIVANFDKFLEYKKITTSQHENVLINFELIGMFKSSGEELVDR